MFIAKEIRKTSIAEYLLYMWQLEDLIRAYDCSLSRITNEYMNRKKPRMSGLAILFV